MAGISYIIHTDSSEHLFSYSSDYLFLADLYKQG